MKMDSWESKIADAFARHGDSVATCLIVDPVERNRKANKAKREGVGGSSHEKMLERSRRYRQNHIEKCREKTLRWQRENHEYHCLRCSLWREKKKLENEQKQQKKNNN